MPRKELEGTRTRVTFATATASTAEHTPAHTTPHTAHDTCTLQQSHIEFFQFFFSINPFRSSS